MDDLHTPNKASPRRRLIRFAFPISIIILMVVLYFTAHEFLGHQFDRQWTNFGRTVMLMLGGTLIGLWALFFTGWKKLPVVTVIALLLGAAWALFRVEYDGDLHPTPHLRDWVLRLFGNAHDDEVEAHRKSQSGQFVKRPIDLTPQPTDFPAYRGAERTGIVHGPKLNRDWSSKPPRVIWKQPTYAGYSAFAVVNGFLFTMEQRRGDEAVVCYDAENGNELWVHSWPGRFEEKMGGVGPRSTPAVDQGDVFALGAFGKLVCLDAKTGDLKWQVETLEGNRNLEWAMSGSPLVVGDRVIVNPGTQSQQSADGALVAYDRKTGAKVRSGGSAVAGYSSPMFANVAGKDQILLFDAGGMAGFDAESLAELWRFPWRTQSGINSAQPIVVDDGKKSSAAKIFIASGYGRGGAMLEVKEEKGTWSVEELWTTGRNAMRCKFASPVLHEGYIYGLDDGDLQCISAEDGKVQWTDKRQPGEGGAYAHGQVLLSDGLLIAITQHGEAAIVEARPDRFNEIGRVKVLKGNKTWNNPALADGRFYIRNHLEMAALDLR